MGKRRMTVEQYNRRLVVFAVLLSVYIWFGVNDGVVERLFGVGLVWVLALMWVFRKQLSKPIF